MPRTAAQLGPLPWKIACGDTDGLPAEEPGWLQLTETSAPPGVSLSPAALDTVHVAETAPTGGVPAPSDVFAVDPDELSQTHRLTSLQLANPTQLALSGLPASKPLRVRLELGALSPWYDVSSAGVHAGPSTVSREVRVAELTPGTSNWRTLVSGLSCETSWKTNTFATTIGGVVPVWCLVHTDATGTLKLKFSTDGGDPVFLTGIEVHAYEPLPVVYHHNASGPLQSTDPLLAGFVAAFDVADYDGARAIAEALVDPWRRGVALCELIGWLDGSRDGRFDLIPAAHAALLAAQPAHPGAEWLTSQLEQLQRAQDHLAARGYAWARACPSDGGYGFLNTACAGQIQTVWGGADTNTNSFIALRLLSGLCAPASGATVLADVKTWNAGSGGSGSWEPSPLVFAALKEFGVTLAAINPALSVIASDPESVLFLQRFRDIFQDGFLDPAYDVGDFPKDVELYLFERYAELGLHPFQWSASDIASVLTDAQIDASWWGPSVAAHPAAPNLPPWAVSERDVLAAFRQVVAYWLDVRRQHGELGGGLGDDVELLQQLMAGFAGQQDQGSRRALDALDDLARHAWDESGVVVDGYYDGAPTDVEHTGEYTTDVAVMLRGAFGHTRRELLEGLAAGRHLVDADDPPAAWAANTVVGRLHFKSFQFTSEGPDTDPAHAVDIPLDGRALFPAVVTASAAPLAAGHPLLADLRRWADAWRDDALSTASGKPAGFLAPVQWPSNAFGSGGFWWSANGTPGDVVAYSKTYVAYELEVLRLAYHTSTASDRWRYLLPAVRMFRAAQQWEDAGQPAGAQGSQNWAAALFRNGPRFQDLTVSHLQDLTTDPVLTTTDDPSLPGNAPYVDGLLSERLHDWAEQQLGIPSGNYELGYQYQPIVPCGTGPAKSMSTPQWLLDGAWPYLRAIYPLLTARVLHTDRVYLNVAQLLQTLDCSQTGGNLAEGLPQQPALRWVGRFGDPLDVSVLINGHGWDESWISAYAYNFADAPVSLDLWLDERLQPGEYEIDVGPTAPKCDEFAAGATLATSFASQRGGGVSVPITLPPGANLVRVMRQGPPSQPAHPYDVAVDPPEIELHKQGGVATLVFRARLANVGFEASPGASLTFKAALLLPDGTPLSLFPIEAPIGTLGVAALPACTDWHASEAVVELPIVVSPVVADVLGSGLAIQVRAEVDGLPDDWNPLNDAATRAWLPAEIPVVQLP